MKKHALHKVHRKQFNLSYLTWSIHACAPSASTLTQVLSRVIVNYGASPFFLQLRVILAICITIISPSFRARNIHKPQLFEISVPSRTHARPEFYANFWGNIAVSHRALSRAFSLLLLRTNLYCSCDERERMESFFYRRESFELEKKKKYVLIMVKFMYFYCQLYSSIYKFNNQRCIFNKIITSDESEFSLFDSCFIHKV